MCEITVTKYTIILKERKFFRGLSTSGLNLPNNVTELYMLDVEKLRFFLGTLVLKLRNTRTSTGALDHTTRPTFPKSRKLRVY